MERLITNLGGPTVRAVVTVLGMLGLLWRRDWVHAVLLGAAVGGAGGANTLVKKVVTRRRPLGSSADGYSFPSGHASGTVALLGSGVYLLWDLTREPYLTAGSLCLALPLAAVIGQSRVTRREHHRSDVVGGMCLGVAWLTLAVALQRRFMSGTDRPS